MRLGANGRLLVLLDSGKEDDDSDSSDDDPHGPKDAPSLSMQRTFLEELLSEARWSYTIVTDDAAFTREFHSGGYTVYALLSEQVKLDESIQKELREAVFRGEGLLVAGDHDARNLHHDRLEEVLGIKVKGKLSHVTAVTLAEDNPLGVSGEITLIPDDKALRIERLTAESVGTYVLEATHDDDDEDDDECGDDDDSDDNDSDDDDSDDDDEEDDCATLTNAVTIHSYGHGRADLAGFDLLVTATRDGTESIAAELLLAALAHVHPQAISQAANDVVPIELELENQGVATSAEVTVTLAKGTAVIDAGLGNSTRIHRPCPGRLRSMKVKNVP